MKTFIVLDSAENPATHARVHPQTSLQRSIENDNRKSPSTDEKVTLERRKGERFYFNVIFYNETSRKDRVFATSLIV